MPANIGYATKDAKTPLAPLPFDRAAVGPEDVRIEIEFCGVCHSDVHQARDEFEGPLATNFPCMPGHEIVGKVTEAGGEVDKFEVGDRVGVGCMVYWGDEEQRGVEEEQYQDPPAVFTYNTEDPDSGEVTFGGYSDAIIVNQSFVLTIPDSLPSEQAAPILCAGVTTWSPMRRWNVGEGMKVGIAGIGGLGHMAIQLAKARGAGQVVALTTTPEKRERALSLGADEVIVMDDEGALEEHEASFDFILSTIPYAFDMRPYHALVKHDGRFVTVGMLVPSPAGGVDFGAVSQQRISIAGSLIGSIAETQEVLDFCAEHGIAADVEVIAIDGVNDAFEKVAGKGGEHARFVIDNSTLPAPDA